MLVFGALNMGILLGLLGALFGSLAGLISVVLVVHKAKTLDKLDFLIFRKKMIVYSLKNFLCFIGMFLVFLILIIVNNSNQFLAYHQYLNAVFTVIFIGLVFLSSNRFNKKIENELSLLNKINI